jgi:hypothetical protein
MPEMCPCDARTLSYAQYVLTGENLFSLPWPSQFTQTDGQSRASWDQSVSAVQRRGLGSARTRRRCETAAAPHVQPAGRALFCFRQSLLITELCHFVSPNRLRVGWLENSSFGTRSPKALHCHCRSTHHTPSNTNDAIDTRSRSKKCSGRPCSCRGSARGRWPDPPGSRRPAAGQARPRRLSAAHCATRRRAGAHGRCHCGELAPRTVRRSFHSLLVKAEGDAGHRCLARLCSLYLCVPAGHSMQGLESSFRFLLWADGFAADGNAPINVACGCYD